MPQRSVLPEPAPSPLSHTTPLTPCCAPWLAAYTFVTAFTILMFFVGGRLRLPILTTVFVYTGIAMAWLIGRARAGKWAVVCTGVCCAAVLSALSFYPWPQIDFRYSTDQPSGKGIYVTSNYAVEYAQLASGMADAGYSEQAMAFVNNAIRLNPGWSYPYELGGSIALRNGRPTEAIAFLKSVVELSPLSATAYNNLGVASEKLGEFQAAAGFYRLALRANPHEATALANLAVLAARSGDRPRAQAYAQTALRVDARQPMALALLAKLSTGTAAIRQPGSLDVAARAQIEKDLSTSLPARIDFDATAPLQRLLDEVSSGTQAARRGLPACPVL